MKTLKLTFGTLAAVALLSGCGIRTSYIGDSFTPTSSIDVYYAAKDVKREYKVIGHISSITGTDENKTKNLIVEKAKAIGADGVIIIGLDFTGGKDSAPFDKADAIKYTN